MILFAKILLTVAAIQFGFIPPIIDFTETHVFHPDWPPHARFHLVWLLASGSVVAAYLLVNIWFVSRHNAGVLRQTSVLGCLVLAAFFIAVIFRSQYGGSLSDMVPPIQVFGIDGNVFSFSIASVLQVAATVILWREAQNASEVHGS